MIEPALIEQTELLLLRREVSLRRREAELRKENELAFYRPHEKQSLFHRSANFRYRYARTGNRFGKSEMGSAEDVAYALGYRPWIPEGDPLRTLGIPPHPTKGLIVTTDWDKSKEVFTEQEGENLGKLFKYIPKNRLGQPTRNHSGAIDRVPIRHASGGWSMIHLDTVKSYKQNPLGQESSVWDFAHIDEPCPEGMWKAIARGLVDRGGHAWFTCTPLSEPWIDEEFVPSLSDNRKNTLEVSDLKKSRFMLTGSMYDNPYNTSEDIALFLSWLTEEEKECRTYGLPTSFSGLVYKEFDWNVHVLYAPPGSWLDKNGQSSWLCPPADHCIYYAIDYHFRKPDAVLFIAVSPASVAYVFAELWKNMLVEEEVREIKAVLGDRIAQPGLVDPLASTPNKITESTQMDEYRRLGLAVLPATKDPVNGIRSVKANLKCRDKNGRPTIFFSNELPRTLEEIARKFVWDGEENKPKKENDDMMENLYRLHLQGLAYIEPADLWDYAPAKYGDLPDNVLLLPEEFNPLADEAGDARKKKYAARYRA